MLTNGQALILIVVVVVVVAVVGYWITKGTIDTWYKGLVRSSLSPPNQAFGIVWTTLYILIGISTYLAYSRSKTDADRTTVLTIFGVQMAMNLGWTWLFFGQKQIAMSGVEIVILLLTIIFNITLFYPIDKTAAWLLVPYALWVAYASALNYDVARLNPHA